MYKVADPGISKSEGAKNSWSWGIALMPLHTVCFVERVEINVILKIHVLYIDHIECRPWIHFDTDTPILNVVGSRPDQ